MVGVAAVIVLVGLQFASTSALPTSRQSEAKTESKLANAIERNIQFVAKEFVELADAMPDDKYSFAPTSGEFAGARTFAQQVLHVANANFEIADSVMGKQPPKDMKKLQTKAELVPYLRASFEALDNAAASLTADNATSTVINPFGGGEAPYGGTPDRIGMLVLATAHSRDHYGQLALYLRMNGIVPPASRKQ